MTKILSIFILVLSIINYPLSVNSQVRPVYDYGAIGLGQLLKKLNTTKSVMMIGAHPDDEDSALLAFLARGENARTAYLSLTRGDGGQNIIGSELFESLGVIRTEELLQARRLDGAEQFFGRAFDYGFSKTLDEAKQKWDEKIVLCDTVRAIRSFRPLVVISRFSGTPADGHGQHQYAGYISPLAVKAAADSNQCQNAGQAWQVQKFYVGQGFRSTAEPTLKVNTGQYDKLIGRSYFEIAMEGRSQHKTQEQGVLELKGEKFSGLNLVESRVQKAEKEASIFDGIDVTISGIGKNTNDSSEPFEKKLEQLQDIEDEINKQNYDDEKLLPLLVKGYKSAYDAEWSTRNPQSKFFLKKKQNEFIEAIKLASGLQIDALSDKETIVADENLTASVRVFFPKNENVSVKEINLKTPNGWKIAKTEEPKDASQNPFRREAANGSAFFNVTVSADQHSTEPYFLKKKRDGYLYSWENDGNQTLSFEPQIASAEIKAEIYGTEIVFSQPLEYRFADDIRGEIRRELNVVPKVALAFEKELIVARLTGKPSKQKISLSVVNNSDAPVKGEVSLKLPNGQRTLVKAGKGDDWFDEAKGWTVAPISKTFELNKKGEKTALEFELTIPADVRADNFELTAQAVVNGETFSQTMKTLAYPHIQTHRFYTPAAAEMAVLDLKTAPVKIGYIAGSGDRVFDAIRQMNFDVQMLSENDLTNADLSKFDTIVVGIRASQVRPDFIANHQRLLDYVKNGGTLLVQYQLPVYQSLLPFPAQMNARVTDENAKVTILDPANPVFNFPNKITDKDFENWVQERNLYAFTNPDANYKSLLESHDENEAENKGGLVVAGIGKGKYIYCSYAFFRQLPAGVPGAYRLFANLLSLPKSEKKKL